MNRQFAERAGPGVRVLLAWVALIPFLGMGWLSINDVTEANRAARRTDRITVLANRLDESIRATALIDDESYWAHATLSLSTLGVPSELIKETVGLDIEGGFMEARAAVDAAAADGSLTGESWPLIEAARERFVNGTEHDRLQVAYGAAEAALAAEIRADLDELTLLATSVGDSEELLTTIEALRLSSQLQESIAMITTSYFAARFPVGRDPLEQSRIALEASASYEADADRLRQLVANHPILLAEFESIMADDAVTTFFERTQILVEDVLEFGAPMAINPSFDFTEALTEADTFQSSRLAVARHVDLIEAISDNAAALAEEASVAASARRNTTIALMCGLFIASLAAIATASFWIVRPLRNMQNVVADLRVGKVARTVDEVGPVEVRSAARALNEAVETIRHAERMATALAHRNLSDDVFDEPTPSRLGTSLRGAVDALAASMSEGEAFRNQLAHEASHDGLTGLANRSRTMSTLARRLEKAAAQAKRGARGHHIATLFIDVDGFKSVNDTAGHAAGDAVLQEVSRRLTAAARSSDHVSRIGGDEFVVIAEPVRDINEAMELAERLRTSIGQPIDFEGGELEVTASIGVSLASDSATPENVLRDADLALYEAKEKGRNRVQYCTDELKLRQLSQLSTERELQAAIHNNEFELYFQPVVATEGSQLTSLEALLRWNRSDGTTVTPGAFIEVAERSDLIVAIDDWVLRAALRHLAAWEDDPLLQGVSIAINLSARSLSVPSVSDRILGHLQASGVDPSLLALEVTETALLDDIGQTADALRALRFAGVRIAIDDFGTGYASLAHLRSLPLDILKIDQSFVANLEHANDRSLVQLTIDTGHLLGVHIVAEGVETTRQAELLDAMGADRLQGYLYARPMPVLDLESWVAQRPPATLISEPVT